MEIDYVSIELARKLKITGFNEPCNRYIKTRNVFRNKHTIMERYEFKECIHPSNYNSPIHDSECSIPTVSLVLKWIRSKGFHVIAEPKSKGWAFTIYSIDDPVKILSSSYKIYNSYEDAIEDGISKALDYIEKPQIPNYVLIGK